MHRFRRLLAVALTFALAVAVALAGAPSTEVADADGASPAVDRLNVVLVLTDDERADADRAGSAKRLLAQEGVTFTRAFATTPACCPARASILTGQYSHHTGVVANSGPGSYPAFDETSTLPVWLQEAGYETALVGKYLNGYAISGEHAIPPGWSDWHAIDSAPTQRYYDYVLNENGTLAYYGNSQRDYSTTVLTNRAVEFVESARRPFFLYFAPLAPHLPATPPPGKRSRVPPLERRPSFNEADLGDKPWRSWHSKRMRPGAVRYVESSIRKRQLQSLQAVDRGVRRIVAALKRRGLLERTVIVYASDNGFLWGEHRLGGKVWPYDESTRVPLVVRTPWQETWGRTDDRLVANVDLASTIAELAGVTPGLPQDGRSIVPLLRGEQPLWRTGVLLEYLGGDLLGHGGPPPYTGLRTRQYLYVEYLNGWRELYDLVHDPWQLRNVADDPAYAGVADGLTGRLSALVGAPARRAR